MTARGVHKAFVILFPELEEKSTGWSTVHGCNNTVRIMMPDGHDMIFTYNKYGNWCLEDARSFRKKK